jgi:hypothetical protein
MDGAVRQEVIDHECEEAMNTDYEQNQLANEKRSRAASVIGLGPLMLMSYQMGLSRHRYLSAFCKFSQ